MRRRSVDCPSGSSAAGVKVAHASPLLPDLAESARLYVRLLSAYWGAGLPPGAYARLRRAAEALSPRNRSLAAERTRGAVMSHRDWLAADAARARLQQQWHRAFSRMGRRALSGDADSRLSARPFIARSSRDASRIDGKSYSYLDAQIVWAELATTPGLPATVAPIDRSESGLPIGVQIIGPYLEDRTTIAFAELLEREFGGFAPPPGYAFSR